MTSMRVNPTCMLPEVKAKKPAQDPNSTKYPGRRFYAGRWRTEAQIEKQREWKRTCERKRYWTDPFEPLRKQAALRELTARKREEQLNGR